MSFKLLKLINWPLIRKSVIVYLSIMLLIIWLKPSSLFTEKGKVKTLSHTLFPMWYITLLVGAFAYFGTIRYFVEYN